MSSELHDWVLVVDDDEWALEITRTMLDHGGIPVQTCSTVEAALAAVDRHGPPAVLLLDVMMPQANGFDVCRRLRSLGALRHTRVLFVTALDDEASQIAALEAGADDLLVKPVREPVLLARIRSLIELARIRDRNHAHVEFETVLDTIGEGVLMLDENDFLLTANRSGRRLLGLPRDWSSPVHLPSFLADHWVVERGTIGRSSHATIVWAGGPGDTPTALDWTSRRLPPSLDTHAAWTVVVRDNTDAWTQDRALDRLFRTLSHKIRIPLTGVSVGLELMAESAAGRNDEQEDLLTLVRDAAARLDTTVLRILEFAEAYTGRGSRRATVLDPARLHSQLGIDPRVELDVAADGTVAIDVDLAARTIEELTANALAAGASRLELAVSIGPDGAVTFAMTDDGRGIAPGLTDRIFEPFFQGDPSGEQQGTGLGLAIIAAEIESHGGSVGASAPASGRTTVWFRLPNTPGAIRPEALSDLGAGTPDHEPIAVSGSCGRNDSAGC